MPDVRHIDSAVRPATDVSRVELKTSSTSDRASKEWRDSRKFFEGLLRLARRSLGAFEPQQRSCHVDAQVNVALLGAGRPLVVRDRWFVHGKQQRFRSSRRQVQTRLPGVRPRARVSGMRKRQPMPGRQPPLRPGKVRSVRQQRGLPGRHARLFSRRRSLSRRVSCHLMLRRNTLLQHEHRCVRRLQLECRLHRSRKAPLRFGHVPVRNVHEQRRLRRGGAVLLCAQGQVRELPHQRRLSAGRSYLRRRARVRHGLPLRNV